MPLIILSVNEAGNVTCHHYTRQKVMIGEKRKKEPKKENSLRKKVYTQAHYIRLMENFKMFFGRFGLLNSIGRYSAF